MKKTLIIFLALAISFHSGAQPSQRQKMIHMAAVRIAEQIEVPESSREAFITLYQRYKGESAEIVRTKAPSGEDPENTAELKILDDFEKSRKILSLRKAYYFKFREILTASQIQAMYDLERVAKDTPAR
ncbi:MAG: hypothetical protein MJY57_02880 [Bacteroidales bacterium]|nr:hypothetical protein [Bacteroidales bacterium]